MNMNLQSRQLAIIIPVFFIAGIGGTMAFNLWQTESSKTPTVIREGEFAGEYNPSDIRGSYSFEDIKNAFGVPVAALAAAFGATDREDPSSFQAKDLEDIYFANEQGEIGTDSIRLFVAIYTGLPHTPEEGTVLPNPAKKILAEANPEADLSAVRFVQLDAFSAEGAEPTESHTEDEEDTTIKGKTTFKELYDWGLTEAEVERVLGIPPAQPGTAIRDYLMEQGIEFSEIKTELQELVDRKQ